MRSPRVWIFSELYYPEDVSTGYLLTHIAQGLTDTFDVRVITGPATRALARVKAPRDEDHCGVRIRRCSGTNWSNTSLIGRVCNMVTRTWTMFFNGLRLLRKGDIVIVVTNPPILPFAALILKWLRRTRLVLLIHDVYPEVLVASRLCSQDSRLVRVGKLANRFLYRQVDRIVCLGRDMRQLAQAKLPDTVSDADARIHIIPHWAECDSIWATPKEQSRWLIDLGLIGQFVVLYAGNLGRTHGWEDMIGAAEVLRSDPAVHLLVAGYGAGVAPLQKTITERRLVNISCHPFFRPRKEQGETLAACDVALITFMSGMSGVSVPSRMYNVMAAGRPIIAVTDDDSELAQVVREEEIGWVVRPGDSYALASAVLEARTQPDRVQAMGRRALSIARTKYTRGSAIESYRRLCQELAGDIPPEVIRTERKAA